MHVPRTTRVILPGYRHPHAQNHRTVNHKYPRQYRRPYSGEHHGTGCDRYGTPLLLRPRLLLLLCFVVIVIISIIVVVPIIIVIIAIIVVVVVIILVVVVVVTVGLVVFFGCVGEEYGDDEGG